MAARLIATVAKIVRYRATIFRCAIEHAFCPDYLQEMLCNILPRVVLVKSNPQRR